MNDCGSVKKCDRFGCGALTGNDVVFVKASGVMLQTTLCDECLKIVPHSTVQEAMNEVETDNKGCVVCGNPDGECKCPPATIMGVRCMKCGSFIEFATAVERRSENSVAWCECGATGLDYIPGTEPKSFNHLGHLWVWYGTLDGEIVLLTARERGSTV